MQRVWGLSPRYDDDKRNWFNKGKTAESQRNSFLSCAQLNGWQEGHYLVCKNAAPAIHRWNASGTQTNRDYNLNLLIFNRPAVSFPAIKHKALGSLPYVVTSCTELLYKCWESNQDLSITSGTPCIPVNITSRTQLQYFDTAGSMTERASVGWLIGV